MIVVGEEETRERLEFGALVEAIRTALALPRKRLPIFLGLPPGHPELPEVQSRLVLHHHLLLGSRVFDVALVPVEHNLAP